MSRNEDADTVDEWFQAAVGLLHGIQNPNLHYADPGRPGLEARQLLADETVVNVRDALKRLGEEDAPTTNNIDPSCYIEAAARLIVVGHGEGSLKDRVASVVRALVVGTAMGLAPETEAEALGMATDAKRIEEQTDADR